jgi:hypothetical protein
MCAEASAVLRAVWGDFYFNCWYLEIPSDNRIRHIPKCVHYHAQGFRLEINFHIAKVNEIDAKINYYDVPVAGSRPDEVNWMLKRSGIL